MKTLKTLAASLAFCTTLAVSPMSRAACTQADLTGTWYATGIAAGPNFNNSSGTTYCKLVIGSTGAFSAATSKCQSSAGTADISGTIKMGTGTNATSCQITAFTLKTKFTSGSFNGQTINQTVDYMVLNTNKTTFSATGNKTHVSYEFLWVGNKI